VPEGEASTATARAALPAAYSRADAVFNVGRTALLLAAFTRGLWECLDAAMRDRLHQPYRGRALFPWLETVFEAARGAGALGVALSGAGPSVLAIVSPDHADDIARAMRAALLGAGQGGSTLVVEADLHGAQSAVLFD
jgi:homoserine kinase